MSFPVLVHNWRAVPDTQGDGTGGPGGGTGPGDGDIHDGAVILDPILKDMLTLYPHDIFYTMDDVPPEGVVSGIVPSNSGFHYEPPLVATADEEVSWNFARKPWASSTDGQSIAWFGSREATDSYGISKDGGSTWNTYNFGTATFNEGGYSALPGSGENEITWADYSNNSGRWYICIFNNTTREQRLYYSSNDGVSWNRFLVGSNTEGDVNAPNYFVYTVVLDESSGTDKIICTGRLNGNPAIPDPNAMAWSSYPFTSHNVGTTGNATLNSVNGTYLWAKLGGDYVAYLDFSTDYVAFFNSSGTPTTYATTGGNISNTYWPSSGSVMLIPDSTNVTPSTTKYVYAITGPTGDWAGNRHALPAAPENCEVVSFEYNPDGGFIGVAMSSSDNEVFYVWRSGDGVTWTGPTALNLQTVGGTQLQITTTENYFAMPLGPTEFGILFRATDGGLLYNGQAAIMSFNARTGGTFPTGGDVTTVVDYGTEQYGNAVVGDATFETAGIVPDGGTAVEFGADGSVVTTAVVANNHLHTFILDLAGAAATTIFDNGDVTVTYDGATIFVNGDDTGLGDATRYLVVRQLDTEVTSYAENSLTPITTDTIATASSTVTQELQGDGVVLDWYILDDAAEADLGALITFLADIFPTAIEYDPVAGLSPTDVTPAPGSNVLAASQPRNQLAPHAWHMRDDGFGMFFLNGDPSQKYTTTDYGDTWTGPIDQKVALEPRSGPAADQMVGQLRHGGGDNYAIVLAYDSNRASDIAYSTNAGASWTRINSSFYAWGVDMVGGEIMHTLRSASSGGIGITNYYTTGGAGYTLHVTSGTTNGAGAVIAATGSWGMALYQDPSNAVFRGAWRTERDPPTIPVWDDVNPNPATTLSGHYGKIPGTAFVFNSQQFFTGDATPTAMAITQLDHLGTSQSNFRAGVAGYQNNSGTMIRSWSFNDGDNGNASKIQLQINTNDSSTGWEDQFHINLPEQHNHSFTGVRDQIMGAGKYWFHSFVGNATKSVYLLRYEWPLTDGLEIPNAAAPSDEDNVKLLINADVPSLLESVDENGETIIDIGNDIAVSPTFSVVSPSPSLHRTNDPKFGAGHLYVPRISYATPAPPFRLPRWRGRANGILSQDLTVDAWAKALGIHERLHICCNQQIASSLGQIYRYGGFTLTARGTGSGDTVIRLRIGNSQAVALDKMDNTEFTGSAMVVTAYIPGSWRFNDYNFISAVRENGRWRLYANGQVGTAPSYYLIDGVNRPQDAPIYDGGDMILGGQRWPFNATEYSTYAEECYIDDFRLVVGEALHKNPIFTVPDAPLTV